MPLADFKIAPGLFTDATDRTARSRWKDGNHVRWKDGLPEKLGGWTKRDLAVDVTKPVTYSRTITYINPTSTATPPATLQGRDGQIIGSCRAIHDWISLDGRKLIALGTHLKLYLINNYTLYDITPIQNSGTLGANPIHTISGSAIVTIDYVPAPGLEVILGQFVTLSGATAVGGITISGNYQITAVTAGVSYTIVHSSNAGSTASGGGAAVLYSNEIAPGSDNAASAAVGGWGVGSWGTAPGWNLPRTLPADTAELLASIRIWSQDNWGQDLVASPRQGSIYNWVFDTNFNTRAVVLPPASTAPVQANRIIIAPEQRILVALGSTTQDLVPVFDQMFVRWSDQEDYTSTGSWTPTFTNRSGSARLTSGSRIITDVATRRETVIFTDIALYSMQFVGGNDVFAFTSIGEGISITGPNAVTQANGVVYFMSMDQFWIYDGVVRPLPCDVRSTVFGNTDTAISALQRENTYCWINSQFNEVWWHYTSQGGTPGVTAGQNDRYVTFNWKENCWYYGIIDRSAMHEYTTQFKLPYGVRQADGRFFTHEDNLNDADGGGGEISLDSFVESYDAEIDASGNSFYHINALIPDFARLTVGGTVTLRSKRYPQATNIGAYVVPKSKTYSVPPGALQISVRMRNRQQSLRWDMTGLNSDWRMGDWRMGVRPHGKR